MKPGCLRGHHPPRGPKGEPPPRLLQLWWPQLSMGWWPHCSILTPLSRSRVGLCLPALSPDQGTTRGPVETVRSKHRLSRSFTSSPLLRIVTLLPDSQVSRI